MIKKVNLQWSLMIFSLMFLWSCHQDSFDKYQINKTLDKMSIDGKADEKAWSTTDWIPMDQVWLGGELSEDDFQGRYKLLWDTDHVYVLAEIKDDKLTDTYGGLERYWDDADGREE